MNNKTKAGKDYGKLLARAWTDDQFKADFIANPLKVIAREGLSITASQAVQMMVNFPSKPIGLSEESFHPRSEVTWPSAMCEISSYA